MKFPKPNATWFVSAMVFLTVSHALGWTRFGGGEEVPAVELNPERGIGSVYTHSLNGPVQVPAQNPMPGDSNPIADLEQPPVQAPDPSQLAPGEEPPPPPSPEEIHQAVLDYSMNAEDGLKLATLEQAHEFAQSFANEPDGMAKYNRFRKAFHYAHRDPEGLQITEWADAYDFAERYSKIPDAETLIDRHKETFNFALRDPEGMQLGSSAEAFDLAETITADPEGFKTLGVLRQAFGFAQNPEGLRMPYVERSSTWARRVIQMPNCEDVLKRFMETYEREINGSGGDRNKAIEAAKTSSGLTDPEIQY